MTIHQPPPAALALRRLLDQQRSDGSWEGEVVWCPLVTALAVITQAIMRRLPDEEGRASLLRHFEVTKCPGGGWGLHPESQAYVFVTVMVYVAARLLGLSPSSVMLAEARSFLKAQPDGMRSLPQWGRIWLSFIGLYPQGALNPCPPELFLLSAANPISPARFYCHTRYIYLGMAYLIGSRFRVDLGPIVAELRRELDPAGTLCGARRTDAVAATDVFERPGALLAMANAVQGAGATIWARLPGASSLRRRALAACLDKIRYEQVQSRFQGLSPMNGMLNALALWADDPAGVEAQASLDGLAAWRWRDEEGGSRYAGARSTTWDTSFALQALLAGGPSFVAAHAAAIRRAYRRLAAMQMMEELRDAAGNGRDPILGGWCFSDGTHRWPVSDCAAEAILALLACHARSGLIPEGKRIPPSHIGAAASFILSRQNADGGFGTYERRRGQRFLEALNPSEMFANCMTERSYIECTASALRALALIAGTEAEIDRTHLADAMRHGLDFLLFQQREDGTWPGFWGVNIVYGTYFALAALRDLGLPPTHPAVERARLWLEAQQKPDGGWGEHFSGCATGCYVEHARSLVITTAWAMLALMCCCPEGTDALRRGAAWLVAVQQPDGDWPRDSVNGVFFGTAMMDYRLYNTYFPAKALAELTGRERAHG